MWRTAMMTQSVGVPLIPKRRSSTLRRGSGSLSESECETPDWSNSGATIQTSSDSACAMRAQTSRPSAWMPSSLVTRMRMFASVRFGCGDAAKRLGRFLDACNAAHIGLQGVGNGDGAALVLIVFQHRDQRAADSDARAIQRVHGAHLLL